MLDAAKRIADYQQEIEKIRVHQENAKTEIAFKGFNDSIRKIKEEIQMEEQYIREMKNDDYDYDHYMYIKNDLEIAEDLMKKDPGLIVVAFAGD